MATPLRLDPVTLGKAAISLGFTPVPMNGKRPLGKGWQNTRIDAQDPLKIARKIGHLPKANNVGVVTGDTTPINGSYPQATSVVVMDIEKAGVDTWNDWAKSNGGYNNTFVVKTPGGGYHIYFKYDSSISDLSNSDKIFGQPMDFRTTGGVITFPGSAGPSGFYVVASGYDGQINRPILASMPPWLINALRQDKQQKTGVKQVSSEASQQVS